MVDSSQIKRVRDAVLNFHVDLFDVRFWSSIETDSISKR